MTEPKFYPVQFSDGDLIDYLESKKALDDYYHRGLSVNWRDPSGKVVALAIYDNEKCTRKVFIREAW